MERSYDASTWRISDLHDNPIPAHELPFSLIRKKLQPVTGFQHYIEVPGKQKVLLDISGVPVIGKDGLFEGAVFTLGQVKVVNEHEKDS